MVMRGEGLMKRAMLIMGIGAGVNILLDPILMILFRERGIEGATVATISCTSSAIRNLAAVAPRRSH